jgi:hypothetical protein
MVHRPIENDFDIVRMAHAQPYTTARRFNREVDRVYNPDDDHDCHGRPSLDARSSGHRPEDQKK